MLKGGSNEKMFTWFMLYMNPDTDKKEEENA